MKFYNPLLSLFTLQVISLVTGEAITGSAKSGVTDAVTVTKSVYITKYLATKTVTNIAETTIYKCTDKSKSVTTHSEPAKKSTMSSSQPKPTETSSQSQPTGNNPSDQPDERSAEMLCLVNKIRSEVSKKPLKLDSRLMKSSQKHSEDQAEHKKMSHDGTKVKFFFDRIKNEGFRAYTGAENVAWNQKNVEKVVQAWKKSEGHYKNIIGEFECFGWGEKDLYWTQNFAAGEKCDDDYVIDCSRY